MFLLLIRRAKVHKMLETSANLCFFAPLLICDNCYKCCHEMLVYK